MATAIERLNALKGNMTAAPVRTDPMGRLNALKGIMKPAATYTPPQIEKPAQIPTAYGFGAAAIGNIHEPIITSQRESQERLASYDVKQGKYSLKALEAQKAQAKTRMEDAQTAQLAAIGNADTRAKAQSAYETYKKIYDDLSAKELQSRQDLAAAEHFQTTQMYNGLTAQPDFQSFSNRGASIDSVVSRPATTTLSGNRSDTHARYSFMSDDEVDIYTYLLAKKGKDAAQEYLNHLEETLNYRQGSASADVVLGSPGRAFNAGMFGIGAGFDQFASGAKQLFSKDRLPTSAMQFGSAKVREGLGGPKLPDWMGGGTLGQAAYDVTTTTANMAPSILLSTITAGLGAPAAIASGVAAGTLGASASGNAYNQALQEGYTEKQARNYSALVGASEGALQYLLGGIGALGGKFLSGSLKTAISNIDSAILRVGATLALDMTSEGTEEYLQEILDPVFRNLMLGENNEVKLFTPEAAYSYILGAITAGFIEGGNTISNSVKLNNLGESIQKAGNYAALLDGALALKVDLASKLSNGDIKPTNQNIGELFAEYVKKGGKADVLAPQSEAPAETPTPTPPQAVPTTTPQAAPVLQPVTNSEAERILADPEALSKLGVVITPDMTKSQQRAAVKAAQAPQAPTAPSQPVQAVSAPVGVTAPTVSKAVEAKPVAPEATPQPQTAEQRKADLNRRFDEAFERLYEIKDTMPAEEYQRLHDTEMDSFNREYLSIVQAERVENGQVSASFGEPENFIENRDGKEVGSRKIKAFQFDYPELHTHFTEAANMMLYDLEFSQKGEMGATQIDYSAGDDVSNTGGWKFYGIKRKTTPEIETLLDEYRLSYADISKALDAIIKNNGQENYAAAKRVELVLDDMLSHGYTSIDGQKVPPNEEYIAERGKIAKDLNVEIKEESDESLDWLFDDETVPVRAAGKPVLKLPTIESRRVSENATTSRPADWTADRVGDAKGTMSISDIVNKIRHDFDVQVTTGHVRGAEGQFNTRTKGIRTKTANDLPTLSHELGHRLDNKYGLRNAPANIQKELIDNLPPDVKGPKLAEGIAEYIRAYLQNSETAAIDYPLFTEYFRKALSESDLELVNSAADEVNAYFSLDVDTAASSIKLKEDKPIDFRSNEEKLKDFGDDFYQNWMDALHGIKMFDKATGANTYKIASNSAYSDAVAYAILTGDLTDINGQPVGEGLLAAIKNINTKNKAEYRAFGEYLAMKHGVEYLQEGKRVFADDRKNSTSFMKKRAAELEKQYPKFKESAEKLYKFQREFLTTYGVELGLVTKESAESWFKDRPFYVPFNRALTKQGQGVKRGFANQSSTIKKAIGSGLDLVHPVDNIVANIVRMVNAAYKNHVMQQITDAAATLEDTAKFLEKVTSTKVTTLKLQGVKDSISKSVGEAVLAGELDDSAAGFMDDLLDGMDDVLKQYGQGKAFGDVVTVLKKGKPEFWKINDPYLLESVTNMNPTRLPAFLNAYGRVSKLMTSAITGTNVVWSIFSNFPRDMQTYFTYSQDKNLINMVGGIFSAYANKVKGNKADPIYKEYLAMGGGRTSAYSADKNLAKTVRGKVRGSKLKWLNPLEWIDFVSDTIELGPRFSYYKMLRSKGFSPQEAFYESTDITVNFRRGGTQARVANKFIPFFNAGVQGLDKFARWITANETPQGSRSKAVRNRMIGFVTVSAVIAALKYALNSLDDDRKKAYAQLSNFTKNNYWCFPMKDGKFFAVPKPREIGVLSSLFEALMEQFGNNNPHAMDDMYGYFADVTLPNAVGDMMQGDWRGAVGSLGIICVAANMMANRDFLGKPILSESMQSLEPKDQYTQRTSKIAYWMGKAFNVSPQMADYFFSQVLGGWWKYQKALFPVGSEEVDLTLGVQNQYVKDNQYSTDLLNRMYDSLEKAEKAKNSNPDDTEKAINYKWYSNIATFYSRFNKLSKNLPETTSNRATRQEVLNLIIEFEKDMENGYKTKAQEMVEKYCNKAGTTELMPSVMNSVIKSEDESYTLDAKQYLKYQSEYLTLYWDYVDASLSRGGVDVGETLKEAKSAAAKTAKANALARLGVVTKDYTKAQEAKSAGVTPWQEILFHSATDSLKSDDALSRQDKIIAAMEKMTWLTEPQKEYLYSTIYSSDYPGG